MAPRSSKSSSASTSQSHTKEATVTINSGPHKPERITKPSSSSSSGGGNTAGSLVGEAATDLILEYLTQQNRPYSATEISANLHNKVTKTNADRILKEMEKKGIIMGKATKGDAKGSQWVFWCLQDSSTPSAPEDLAAMDSKIENLRETLPLLRARQKDLRAKLSDLRSMPTTLELRDLIHKLSTQRQEKEAQLDALRNGKVQRVSKEEMEKAEREWKIWDRTAKVRRKCFLELEATLLEAGISKDELWERAGIEEVE